MWLRGLKNRVLISIWLLIRSVGYSQMKIIWERINRVTKSIPSPFETLEGYHLMLLMCTTESFRVSVEGVRFPIWKLRVESSEGVGVGC